MKNIIYADNAATTKLSENTLKEMLPFLLDDYSNPSQPYSFSRKSKMAIEQSRKIIANCINALPEEIFFTSGGSESNNWAVKSMGEETTVITSNIEHHAILNACSSLKNGEIIKISADEKGIIKPENLVKVFNETIIEDKKKNILVSIMMANNEIGTIEPIKELSKIAHDNGAIFHTDAVQCVGHVNIDVKELNVDMLSASAHKFNGPKGIGFLYIKKGTKVNPFINGGKQEKGFRAGTENVASIVGMATALKQNHDEIESNTLFLESLDRTFIDKINELDIDYIRNGSSYHLPGLISISIKNANGEMLLHRLDLKKIYISTGSACDSQNDKLSHVIEAIGVNSNYSKGTIRISFGKYNKLIDSLEIANALKNIIESIN